MFNNGFGNNGDFEAMARQYWSAWGDAMRQSGAGAAPAQPASQWQQAVGWWSQLMPGGPSQANDAVGRFNQQASQWFGQMQQVAAQFAGQDNSASDISQAWRRAMGAHGDNPFPEMLKAMRGQGAHGLDEWLQQVKPYLDGFQQQSTRWQQMPAFGQYREHQERWQALQQAQQDYQQQTEAFNALMGECAKRAFEVFEDKLTAHEEPGRQITSARGLFDLWIDSAEQAYATVALSPEFRQVYGALGNAQMRLRAAVQLEVEHMTGLFGIPTRTEIDSAHRKIAELERALRRAAAAGNQPVAQRKATAASSEPADAPASTSTSPAPAPQKAKPRRPARKPTVARKRSVRKPAARQPEAKKVRPAKKAAARKVAAKPAVVMQSAAAARTRAPAKRKAKTTKASVKKSAASAAEPLPAKVKRKSGSTTKSAAKPATAKKSTPVHAAKVVSMKDWVARYAAMNTPQDPGSDLPGRKGARK
ncbi:MAG: class III poly(R)-hydroxyalkanoic acid synthase subunit PhaE [Pseudoxanthomonas sp.]